MCCSHAPCYEPRSRRTSWNISPWQLKRPGRKRLRSPWFATARRQAIAFGNHTFNAVGNEDNLFIYGETGVQAYVATPTQARMPVGSQVLIGNNFKRGYAYSMGGTDTATHSGSAADETMTALAFYTFVNTASTVQYLDSFKTLTVAGNGGLDIGVMYDSAGVDTFTASDTSFRYSRSGVFNNIANGYDRVYAFNYFGGSTSPRSTAAAVTTN